MEKFSHMFAGAIAVFGMGVVVVCGVAMAGNATLALADEFSAQPAAVAATAAASHTQLTAEQQQAIISLLASFNVDQATVNKVTAVLSGAGGGAGNGEGENGMLPGQAVAATAHLMPCPTSTQILGQGSRGPDVGNLQEFLTEKGYLNASSTNFFGPMTEQALMRWQADNGVVASGTPQTTGFGVFGPKTRMMIGKACGLEIGGHNPPPPPPSATAASTSDQ